MPLDLKDDKSTLDQVKALCHQAPSHNLNQYWPKSKSPYGVTRPQRVKHIDAETKLPPFFWQHFQVQFEMLNCSFSTKISLKLDFEGLIHNKSALVWITARCSIVDWPLSEPMMARLLKPIYASLCLNGITRDDQHVWVWWRIVMLTTPSMWWNLAWYNLWILRIKQILQLMFSRAFFCLFSAAPTTVQLLDSS